MKSIPLHDATGATIDTYTPCRIICIGRNYADHAKEMGHNPDREAPFFFFKPLTALNVSGELRLPNYSNDVHHELELVLALGSGGSNLDEEMAKRCIGSVALGLDMTCRDIQKEAKKAGRPWELAKGFDGSAPLSPLLRSDYAGLDTIGDMTLTVNQCITQSGNWRDLIWSPEELISQISQFIELHHGDLIFTGTPAGVGPVKSGDQLVAKAQGFPFNLELAIT